MLKGLNEYFDLQIPFTDLMQYASRLGSDCAFFIENKTSIISGRGDIITPVPEVLKDKWLCIFNPGIGVSTAEAYSMVTPDASRESLVDIFLMDMEKWRSHLVNDFEKPVFSKYPLIGEIKKSLYDSGALYASMSGSGSSVYGIFREKPALGDDLSKWMIWEEKI
jgi:4-diphosphocytidyl-2-C-methyl-D-erythritol kinase